VALRGGYDLNGAEKGRLIDQVMWYRNNQTLVPEDLRFMAGRMLCGGITKTALADMVYNLMYYSMRARYRG
jgi:hypothetical protein